MTLKSNVKVKKSKFCLLDPKLEPCLPFLFDVVHIWHTDCLWCVNGNECFELNQSNASDGGSGLRLNNGLEVKL